MALPQVVAVQLDGACQNITFEDCTFHDGYYVTIQGRADNLLVKDCDIENCKSGINIQYAYGAGLILQNTDISVVAQGAANDTYCVRFGSASGSAENLSITDGDFTVDTNGLTPDAGTYFHAIVVREAATGTLAVTGTTINGEIANLSATPLAGVDNLYYVVYVDDDYTAATSGWGAYAFASIQDALTAVQTSGTVHVAAGTYTQSVTVNKPISLVASGDATIIGTAADAVTVAADGVRISGFTVQNPNGLHGIYALNRNHLTVSGNIIEKVGTGVAAPSSVPCGVMIYSTIAAVDDVLLTGNVIRGIESKGNKKSANGIWVGDSAGNFDIANLVIQGNVISNIVASPNTFEAGGRGAYGIIINHAISGTGRTLAPSIKDNLITDLEGVWAHAVGLEGNTPDAVVQGNTIARIIDHKSPAEPDAIGIMVEQNLAAASVAIISNSFSEVLAGVKNVTAIPVTANGNYWGSATPDLDALVLGDVVTDSFYADAALTDLRYFTVFVDGALATESGNQFKTIQGGVNAVSPFGTVNVAAGTYLENVAVNKTVNLVGAGAATTTINGGNSGVVVAITDNDVELSGFTVTGAGATPIADAGVILQGVTRCEVRDCVVSANGGVGIGLQGANGNTIQNNTVAGNVIAGIGLLGSADNTVAGNTVSATTTFGTQYGYGIVLDGIDLNADDREDLFSTGNTITGNLFEDNQGDGVYLGWACNDNTIADNTLSGNGNNGLYIWKADGNSVQDNTVSDNLAEGIQLMASAGNAIIGNVISGSATSLWIRSGWTQFESHTAGHEDLSAGNTILTNSFLATVAGVALEDNTEYTVDDAGLVDVSANYWGTAFGPSGDGFFGTGSAIVGAIDIGSYFVDSPLATLHYTDLYVDDNGSEDATHFLSIQAAYAAANPGDTIHVAAGTYVQTVTLTLAKPGLTLTGAARADVIIDVSACGAAWGIHVKADDVTLEHFTVMPENETGGGYPIHAAPEPVTPGVSIANLVLRDIAVSGSYRTAFDLHAVNGATLDGLTALNTTRGNGIQITGCTDVTLTDCTTSGNAWGGVALYNSTYSASSCANVTADLADNNFGEVQAIYVQDPGVTGLNITGYSYVIASSATTTYADGDVNEAIALALFYDSLGSAATTITEADGDPVLYAGETGTAIVYVDDDWAGTVSGAGVQKPDAPAGTYLWFGHNAFATIQSAVVGVAESGTVHIANGLYLDSNTTLDKAMTLVGQSRDGVVVAPAAEDENLTDGGFTGVSQHGFVIASSDVTVTNLTIDGKANVALTAGKCNFRAGVIANSDVHSNVVLADLTIRNTWLYGIYVRTATVGQGGTGNAILNCRIEDMGYNAYPSYGIFSSYTGEIAGNVITNAGYRGICLYNANVDVYDNTIWTRDYDPVEGSEGICIYGDTTGVLVPSPVAHVYRNTIYLLNETVKGVGMNVLYGTSNTFIGGDTLEDGNVIYLNGGSAADHGIECWWTKTGQPLIQNNTVYADGDDSAVWMFANRSKTAPVDGAAPIFKGNHFYATNSDGTLPGRGTGIFMTEDMAFFKDGMDAACYAILKGNLIDGFARGIDLYRSGDGPKDYDEREHTVQAVIGGTNPADANTIQNCGVGVRLFVHPDAYDGPLAKVCDASILGNTTTFAGNEIAILLDGGTASVTQNSLYDNGVAIKAINGGSLTALYGNTFEGGETRDDNGTDLLIAATAGTINLGTGNAFAGDVNYIDNHSTQSFDLTANNTTFDQASPYAIENLVYHKVDNAALGLVRTAAGAIYVTQESGSIQRGIDAATAGETVYVGAGTYEESVTLTPAKEIVLAGEGRDVVMWIAPPGGTCITADLSSYTGAMAYNIFGFTFNCRSLAASEHGTGINIFGAANGSLNLEIHDNRFIEDRVSGDSDHWATSMWLCHNRHAARTPQGEGAVRIYGNIDETWGGMTMSNSRAFDIFENIFDGCSSAIYNGHGCPDTAGQTFGDHWIAQNLLQNASDNLHPGSTSPSIAWYYYGEGGGTHLPSIFENNVFADNDTAIEFSMDTAMSYPAHIIRHNSFAGNKTALDVFGANASTLDAQFNWWGDATGPSSTTNPGGLGDAVSGAVDFSPWLGSGLDTQTPVIGFQPNLTQLYYLPAGLKFTASPASVALGATLSTTTVQVTNEIGEVAMQFTGDVTIAIGSQPGSGVLTGTLTKPCVDGEVSFADLAVTIDGGSGFTLAASAASPIAGATSAAFDIANPAPVLDAMDPIFAAAGSGDLTLTLSGSAFVGSSAVKWGAAETVLVPASVTADSMTVTVPAALLTTAGTAAVKVFSPAEGGGTSSDLTFTITATALAPEVWVDDDWTGPANCGVGHVWGYDAFATVQGGLDGAAAGATVSVASGLYTEDIKINRHVTLLGPKADAARNTGSATDWTSATTAGWTADDAEAAGEAVIRSAAVVADGVVDIAEDCHATIKGFVVEARNRTDSTGAHLIYVEAKNATLQTVTIENNIIGPVTGADQDGNKGRFGISFNSQSSGNNGLAGVVRGNKILGAEGNGANLFIIGQHYNPSMADYSGMLIESNDVYGANRSGIEIAGGVRGLTIRDNWIAYNGYIWNGSAYVQSAKSQATPDNILYGAGVNLIRTGTICGNYTPENQNAIENLVLSGNTITKNEKSGVYVDAQQRNLSILGNEITDNGRDGIWLDEYGTYNKSKTHHAAYGYIQNAVVNGNRITGAVGAYAAIRVVGKPLNLSISDNDLSGNAVSVVQNDGAGQSWDYIANASGNWWGTADAATVAALVSGDVDYSPWLADGTDTDGGALGFKGDFSALWVGADSPQTGAIGRIQEGANLVVNGGTVNVAAGTYAEDVVITTPLTLLGPNADKTGFDAARVGEAILIPSEMKVDLDEPYPGKNDFTIVAVQTNNVTISGFTFCGDNPDIDGFDHAGMNVELGNAVISQGHNVVLRNNIVDQFTKCGFKAKGTQQTTWQGLVVDGNLIKNVHDVNPTGYGMGLYVQGTAGKVTNNVIRDCRLGMQIQPYQIVGDTVLVRDNTIAGWAISIWYNYAENGASAWSISDNRIRASLAPAAMTTKLPWVGVRMETMRASGNGALIQNNTIDGAAALLDPIHADWDGFDNAVWGAHYRGGSSLSDQMVLIDNVFTNLSFGFVHSAPVDVAFAQNTLHVRDAAIVIQPAGTMTGTESATNNIDATGGNIVNGVDTTTATLEQLFALEDFINHKVDNSAVGLVRVREDNLYVTQSSGSIQRGVDAATAGDTVSVAAGTYSESVALNKPLTLAGPAAGEKPLLVGMLTGTYTGGLSMRIENIDFKVNATDKNNLKFTGVKNLTVKGCDFDADERYMTLPQVVAVQLEGACQNITLDACTFHDGYYVTIQSANSVDNLLVKDCLIDDCKSGINIQYASGAGLTVTNSEINVVAQGAVNDTYCVRFGSKSGLAQSLNIAGGVFTVDRNGLTPDADTYFNAVIVRAAASGTLALSQSSIQGGVVNLSETPLTAENNWFGSVTGPTSTLNAGGTGDAVIGSVDFSPWLGDGTDTQPEIIGFQPNLTPVYYLPAGIWFSTEPAGALLGAPLGTQPVITVTNEIGEVATQFNGSVTLAIGNNPGEPVAGELSGTVTLPVANGVAAFSDLAIIKGTGNGYTLVASTEGLPAVTSTAFDIENSTPVLAPIGNQTVDEEALLTFPATATDTAADLVAQTLTFSLSGEVPDGASITTNGVFTWTPTEEQGGADYTFTVVVTDNGTGELSGSETITITVNEVNVAPTLQGVPTTQLSVDEQPDEALTFTATATDQDRPAQTLTFKAEATDQDLPEQTLTYTMTGGPEGATLDSSTGVFTWTPTEEQAKANYSFTIKVTDSGDPVLSDEQTVTIGAISAAHSCPGYWSPSISMVVSNTFAFGGTLTNLTWTPVLPNAGWVITAADAGGNGVAEVNSDGTAVVFTTLPTASPVVFTYTVSVPGDQAVSNSLGAVVSFSGLSADVAPIAIFRYHSADYRRDQSGETAGQFRKIDSTEINRVLSYWRFGYKPDAAGYDGFSAVSNCASTATGYHSADVTQDWVIDVDELLVVQSYWRGGGYHVDLTTDDGYAANRAGIGPSLFALAGIPVAGQTAPSGYNPGETLQVTYTLDPAGASLLALSWVLDLPDGWVIEGVSGDAAPTFTRNEIVCNAAVLPASTATVTVTLRVPLTEIRTATLGGTARLIAVGGRGVERYAMEAATLAPVDEDNNGMADSWERAFAGDAGTLDPAADLDGDTMSNLNEYLCGTLPNDAESVLKMVAVQTSADGAMQVSWASVAGRTYTLQRADGSPAAANFKAIQTGIAADPSGRNVYIDRDADGSQARFYRVVLED